MCYASRIDSTPQQAQPIGIGANIVHIVRTDDHSLEARILLTAAKCLAVLGATFSAVGFFATGEPLLLLFSVALTYLSFYVLSIEDQNSYNDEVDYTYRTAARTNAYVPQSIPNTQMPPQVIIRETRHIPTPAFVAPGELPTDPIERFDYRMRLIDRLSDMSGNEHAPVGRRNQSTDFGQNHITTSRPQYISPMTTDFMNNYVTSGNAPIGRRNQQTNQQNVTRRPQIPAPITLQSTTDHDIHEITTADGHAPVRRANQERDQSTGFSSGVNIGHAPVGRANQEADQNENSPSGVNPGHAQVGRNRTQ